MYITADWINAHACPAQAAIFLREWPVGGEITTETLARARALGLDLLWLSKRVVVRPAARAAFHQTVQAAQAAYDQAAWAAASAFLLQALYLKSHRKRN